MAELSGLSVRVSAATTAFRAGMSRAEDAAQDLSLSLSRLSFASERADDNLDEVGRSALGASGGMVAFGASTEGAGFSVRGLSSSILLSLVPALGVLGGALVPLVVALGGFVAVAGSIGGIGLVGTIGAIATHTEELKARFMEVVGTFKDEFMPVFDTAAEVLFTFMDAFEDVIPALVPAQDVISELAGNFAQLGVTIIDALPAFVDLATTLALEFLPPFVTFVQDVLPRVPDMIQHMGNVFGRVLPTLMDFGRAVADIYPDLLAFGFVALDAVADSLGFLGGILAQTLSAFNNLDSGLQGLLARAALVAPVVLAIGSLIGGLTAPIFAVIGAVGLLAAAYQTDFANVRNILNRAAADFQQVLGDRLPTLVNSALKTFEAWRPVLEPLFNFISTALGFLVVQGLDSVLTTLTILTQLLRGDFSAAWETYADSVERSVGRIDDIIPTLKDVTETISGTRLEEFLQSPGAQATGFTIAGGAEIATRGATDIGNPSVAGTQVNVTIEGELPEDAIRGVSTEVVNEQQRSTRRRQGRGGNII